MINNKLRELAVIASDGSKDGARRFAEFAGSAYFNKNSEVAVFCNFLVQCALRQDFEPVNLQYVSRNLFNGKLVSERKKAFLLTRARKLFEHYLKIREFEKSKDPGNNLLLKALIAGGAKTQTRAVSKKLDDNFRQQVYRDAESISHGIALQKALIEIHGFNIEKDLSKEYLKLSDLIDKQFIISKLELANSQLSRKYHVLGSEKADFRFLADVVGYVKQNSEMFRKNEPALYSEYLVLRMMTPGENEKFFHELFDYVTSGRRKFSSAGLELAYYSLINYASNRASMGDSVFLNYLFRIYQSFEKNGFYESMKIVQDLDFAGIIVVSLRVGKNSWAVNFLKKYSAKLPAETKKDTVNLAYGLIEFSKKNFEQSAKYISQVDYVNAFFYLKAKETLVKICYETGDNDALVPLLDSMRHYLNRKKKLLSIHYNRYIDFLNCVSILVRSRNKDRMQAYKLFDELRKKKNLISYEWFNEKLCELEEG